MTKEEALEVIERVDQSTKITYDPNDVDNIEAKIAEFVKERGLSDKEDFDRMCRDVIEARDVIEDPRRANKIVLKLITLRRLMVVFGLYTIDANSPELRLEHED